MAPQLRPGRDAKAHCISRFVHPSKPIREKYPNAAKGHKLEGVILIAACEKVIRRNTAPAAVYSFSHPDFPDIFYAARRYVHLTEEGPEDLLFATEVAAPPRQPPTIRTNDETRERTGGTEATQNFQVQANTNLGTDDMAALRRQGIDVDDDNDPAPENVPTPGVAAVVAAAEEEGIWKSEGIICPRLAGNQPKSSAAFKNYSKEEVSKMSKLELFLILFPLDYLLEVLIPETNKQLDAPMDCGEFIRWIGCWFYMALWVGIPNRHDWWSTREVTMFFGAPFRLNDYMSRDRFDSILAALRYTDEEVGYVDGFLEMRKIEERWNQNMEDEFDPSWMNVLDESMMEWFNKYAPGFMCVGRKPHPFGNERHTICCGTTTIMWRAQIVEGKDRPQQRGPKEYNELGKTVGLMLRMCKPIFGAGKAVVFDSGFCVAKGIVELAARGVYGGALIKKRRYWPKSVPGDLIDRHFADKEVGDYDMLETTTEEGKPFKIFCFKEPDYVMKIMASWMTLNELEGAQTKRDYKDASGRMVSKKFCYRQPFGLHFKYRHQVDDHNNRRHAPISLERTWATKFWADRNFAWYLAVSFVNVNLAHGHFQNNGEVVPTLLFRREFARECLENTIGQDETDVGRPVRGCNVPIAFPCELVTIAHFCGMWDAGRKKFKKSKQKYQKQRCIYYNHCKNRTRSYCKCTKGHFLCVACFADHKVEVVMNC
jgi:hypothetical protein